MKAVETKVAAGDYRFVGRRRGVGARILHAGGKRGIARVEVIQVGGTRSGLGDDGRRQVFVAAARRVLASGRGWKAGG
jgi:hypothetical protein